MDNQDVISEQPRKKPGPEAQYDVRMSSLISDRQDAKIERVRKAQRFDTRSQALRYIIDTWRAG